MDEMGHERTWGAPGASSIWKPPPEWLQEHLVMLQDKSLITGNYGLPILPNPHQCLYPSCKAHCLIFTTFILSFNRRISQGEGNRAGEEGGKGAITWEQTLITATDALLHFYSCGVAHLWAAITDRMIQTGASDEGAGLTECLAAPSSFAWGLCSVLCF